MSMSKKNCKLKRHRAFSNVSPFNSEQKKAAQVRCGLLRDFFLTAIHDQVTRSAPTFYPNDPQHLTLTPEDFK